MPGNCSARGSQSDTAEHNLSLTTARSRQDSNPQPLLNWSLHYLRYEQSLYYHHFALKGSSALKAFFVPIHFQTFHLYFIVNPRHSSGPTLPYGHVRRRKSGDRQTFHSILQIWWGFIDNRSNKSSWSSCLNLLARAWIWQQGYHPWLSDDAWLSRYQLMATGGLRPPDTDELGPLTHCHPIM